MVVFSYVIIFHLIIFLTIVVIRPEDPHTGVLMKILYSINEK